MKKTNKIIIGLLVIINIILIFLRFEASDSNYFMGNTLSTITFFLILSLLLYFFFARKYDYFILTWLSFYFASPIIILPFTSIGSLGILNAIFIPLMIYNTVDFKNKQYAKYFILICLLFVISIFNIANSDIRIILSRIFLFVTPLIFFYFVFKKCKDVETIMWGSIIITLINLPLGIYQIIYQPSWGTEVDWRGIRIFGNLFWHNSYSFYLLPSILIIYAYFRKYKKPLYLIMLLALITIDIFTFSRTGLITLAISILVFELIYKTGLKITPKKILIFSILIMCTFLYLIIYPTLDSHLTPSTINERTAIWESITPYLKGNLVLGNGIGSYEIYRENFLHSLSTHNYYLNILFELGVIGLILFLVFLLFIFKDLKTKLNLKQKSTKLPFGEIGIALLIGIIIYSIVGNAAFSQVVALNVWIILACCVKKDEKN